MAVETQASGGPRKAGTNPEVATPKDAIKGWNDRRKSNNQIISGLVPFVQLIALFDEEEYKQMFKFANEDRVSVVFDEASEGKSAAYNEKYTVDPNYYNNIKKQIGERFINLYMIKSVSEGLNIAPIEGVILAEKTTQMQDPSGGIGITDLQVDHGKNINVGSRKFVVRMTINDPKVLDERFEYGKLATMGAKILIIYGWSNPGIIPGYDAAMSPPKLEIDPREPVVDGKPRHRLIVPLHDLGNGGYWSAALVNISDYDFGFNELGKLEMTITLRDTTTKEMASTVMSSIAKKIKLFLQEDTLDQVITSHGGGEFTLRSALRARQAELNKQYRDSQGTDDPMAYSDYTSLWEEALKTLEGNVTIEGEKTSEVLMGEEGDEFSYITEEEVREKSEEARRPQKGYPFQNAMYSYKQIFETVRDFNPDVDDDGTITQANEDAADENGTPAVAGHTKQVVSYEKTAVYYYLGALMDSVSLSMAGAGTQQGISDSRVPSFFYRDISPDSTLSTAFQSKLKSVNRATGMEERIQEAIIRLKERFLPPGPNKVLGGEDLAEQGWIEGARGEYTRVYQDYRHRFAEGSKSVVCGTIALYDGEQTENTTRILNVLMPAPPTVSQMVGAPMRGHFKKIDTNLAENKEKLADAGLTPYEGRRVEGRTAGEKINTLYCFIPDWKQEINIGPDGQELKSVGHPEGFDPLNPSEYKAADRGGKFFMFIKKDDWGYVLDYDVWRLSNTDSWMLLQKKWHNMYVEYLGAYFESLIRKRVNDLIPLGIPIEAIYDEALDLDWLTGIIFNNNSISNRNIELYPWDRVAGSFSNDFNIVDAELKYNQDITKQNKIIAENTELIEGVNPPPAAPAEYQMSRNPAYLDKFTGLRGSAKRLVEKINKIKIELEQLTGGYYERDGEGEIVTRDIMNEPGVPNSGNIIMVRFRNFDKIVAAGATGIEDEDDYEIETTLPTPGDFVDSDNPTIYRYNAEIKYEYKIADPKLKEAWILWNQFKVPTNNFQNEFNIETREWMDEPNKAEKWKQQNDQLYQWRVVAETENGNRLIKNKLNTIGHLQNDLNDIYDEYRQKHNAIENANTNIDSIKVKIANLAEFFDDIPPRRDVNSKNTGKLQLSLYDDTSEFDSPVEINMGRDEPMILTTKVAQQWYRRFQLLQRRGALDVRNYGPPQDGKPYYQPTNVYTFRFKMERRGWKIQGQPRRVLDPAIFSLIEEKIAKRMLGDLSYGVPTETPTQSNLEILSKNMEYDDESIGRITRKDYKNWSLFGTPGIPNDFGNNEWGFTYGPPTEITLADETIELGGGNYVRSYQDFLNLFGMGYNPEWPENLRIMGRWPQPSDTNDAAAAVLGRGTEGTKDAERLMESSSQNISIYTLIDGAGNIIVDDGDGWYRPSGWHLDFAGDPIFLYPSRKTACKINNTADPVNGIIPGGVIDKGFTTGIKKIVGGDQEFAGGDMQYIGYPRSGMHRKRGDGRSKGIGQALADGIASMAKSWWASVGALASGDWGGFQEVQKDMYGGTGMGLGATGPLALLRSQRNNALNHLSGGDPIDHMGNSPSWGGRLNMGDHCMKLTLDMKRSMVINRASTEDATRFLGRDWASPKVEIRGIMVNIGPITKIVDWSNVTKGEDGLWRVKADGYPKPQRGQLADYSGDMVDGKPTGGLVGPVMLEPPPYSNPDYPWGTGFYRFGTGKQHGPWTFPEIYNGSRGGQSKSWVGWSDFLVSLGRENGYGFFTQIDNSNNTSCMVQPNGQITDGLELNEGFVKFIIENVYAPLPKNRRCGARDNHKPIVVRVKMERNSIDNYYEEDRLGDVTYGDLFGPLRDESEDDEAETSAGAALDPANFGNIDNFVIENVRSIPIRADLVNNLVNKNNTNMSVTQFLGEILKPGAIGVNNAGNQQMAIRQTEAGVFEVFSLSSINWQEMVNKYAHLFHDAIGREDELKKRFPEDIMMLDFKASDSLIESLNVSSKFDALTTRAFRNAAVDFTGNEDALMNFLSYKEIGPELKTFFKDNYPDDEINKAITIDEATGEITINRSIFMKESGAGAKDVVVSAVSKYLQANQGRLNSMRAMLHAANSGQTNSKDDITQGNDYATQLLSNYMKKMTITIHGTCNITPWQLIIVKGIMPNLEGMYLISTTRESITPQGFQTILEGTLMRAPSANARGDGDVHVPKESSQPDIDKAAASEVSEGTVDAAVS